jgi:adenosylcobinamide kinase/adenosylcobinamide-phosphate guanylyltransferase
LLYLPDLHGQSLKPTECAERFGFVVDTLLQGRNDGGVEPRNGELHAGRPEKGADYTKDCTSTRHVKLGGMRELILGGARSGKSQLAETRAAASGLHVIYVATAQAFDGEMTRRIAHHRARRPPDWGLIETPLDLAATLRRHAATDVCLLVDCLTLWLSNLLFAGEAARQAEAGKAVVCPRLTGEIQDLLDTLPQLPGHIVLVSNEVGWGVVPMAAVSRLFADEQGRLNQRVAAVSEQVTLVAAGLPLRLK